MSIVFAKADEISAGSCEEQMTSLYKYTRVFHKKYTYSVIRNNYPNLVYLSMTKANEFSTGIYDEEMTNLISARGISQ